MGWLTQDFPEQEARLFIAMGIAPIDAARDISGRIIPYSIARQRADAVCALLADKHNITGATIKEWLLNREDWSLVPDMLRFVTAAGDFNATAAAQTVAADLEEISNAHREEIRLMFDEAQDEEDEALADKLAEGDTSLLREKYLADIKAQRRLESEDEDH